MAYLLAKDTVNGAEGSIVVTRNGRNYVIAGMRNIRPVGNIQSEKMSVVGTRNIQDKPGGVELAGHEDAEDFGFDVFAFAAAGVAEDAAAFKEAQDFHALVDVARGNGQ